MIEAGRGRGRAGVDRHGPGGSRLQVTPSGSVLANVLGAWAPLTNDGARQASRRRRTSFHPVVQEPASGSGQRSHGRRQPIEAQARETRFTIESRSGGIYATVVTSRNGVVDRRRSLG